MNYNLEEIKNMASYCLNCQNKPCKNGCPFSNNIPDFIKNIKEEKYSEASEILDKTTVFEPICGRICPQKKQCEGSCIRAIKGTSVEIGKLEAFIGDYILEKNRRLEFLPDKNKKVAIIGAGPAGLAAAYYLSKNGVRVTIFEKHKAIGGLLRHGVPDFRLDKAILDEWIEKCILNRNIEIKLDKELEKDIHIENLKKDYDAILLCMGANMSIKMDIKGKENILGANELLENKDFPDFKEKEVVIIGGGDVSIDIARTVKRLDAKSVTIIYRRDKEQMPAEEKEIESAEREKIKFIFRTNILEVENKKIKCIKTNLIQKEDNSRAVPVNIEGTEHYINADYVIMAIGAKAEEKILKKLNIDLDENGYIIVDSKNQTSDKKIFAAGDIINNKKTVAWAARSGFDAAQNILDIL